MTSEAAIQQQVRLKAAYAGIELWRNNSGACTDQTGRLIRYGLGNDSAALNKSIKSSDLIGITPVVITPDMIGKTIGVFTAIECKASDWKMQSSDERAQAQLRFMEIVMKAGGYAGFASHPDHIFQIIGKV